MADESSTLNPGFLKRVLGGKWGKSVKWGAGIAAVLAVGGGLWAWARKSEKDAEVASARELHERAMANVEPAGGNTMMGLEPAPGQHAARVLAGRGMGPAQGVDASQPNLAVGGSVQQLGA